MPPIRLDATIRDRMKRAMEKRYNAALKALDLTQFHLDADLTDIYCGLSRTPIFSAAADIITENIADIEALKLDGNKINSLEMFRNFLNKLPHLKILHIGNNKVNYFSVFFIDWNQFYSIRMSISLKFSCIFVDYISRCSGTAEELERCRFSTERKSNLRSPSRWGLCEVLKHFPITNVKYILFSFLSSLRLAKPLVSKI